MFRDYYESLRGLIEAYLLFEGIVADNHQCKNAYLCLKHPELEFSWDFFERVRTKRNGINYYGSPVNFDDWKEVELQFSLYIKRLKEEINKKLKS